MGFKEGDLFRLKKGAAATFQTYDGRMALSAGEKWLEEGHLGKVVTDNRTTGGALGWRKHGSSDGTHFLIAEDAIEKVFPGGFVAGDRVTVTWPSGLVKATGTVEDTPPISKEIDPTDKVPVRIDWTGSIPGLYSGTMFYTPPKFVAKLTEPTVAPGTDGAISVGAFKTFTNAVDKATAEIEQAVKQADAEDAGVRLEEVPLDQVSWKTLQSGDVVTAEHKSKTPSYHPGGSREIATSRTSTVAGDDGLLYWCELELDGSNSYDAYKITKVLRKVRPRTLIERRKPVNLIVRRTVPASNVWPTHTVTTQGDAVVEHDGKSDYWLHFVGGPHDGKRIRLKLGRDQVSYTAIAGLRETSASYPVLQQLTHYDK